MDELSSNLRERERKKTNIPIQFNNNTFHSPKRKKKGCKIYGKMNTFPVCHINIFKLDNRQINKMFMFATDDYVYISIGRIHTLMTHVHYKEFELSSSEIRSLIISKAKQTLVRTHLLLILSVACILMPNLNK